MPYRIAGIDLHKKMLAVVVADVESNGEYHFERQRVGTSPADLRALADWFVEREVEEVVMESTAQYWRPVWEALERHWRPKRRTRQGASPICGTLHLAQAQSNRGAGGRKKDFPDAERLLKRLVAQELTLSFVPDAEQRLWRTVMRRKYQITRNRVQLHSRLESLLEEAHIKLSSLVSDLLGTSARRMLQALADGETDPARVASLADQRLRATAAQLSDALSAGTTLHPVCRRLLKLTLEELRLIEEHLGQLDQQMADLLAAQHEAVQRLAEVPGLGVDSAQQIIAEVGATAATFPSPKHLASWMGACPGTEESAGKNYSHRCPKGKPLRDSGPIHRTTAGEQHHERTQITQNSPDRHLNSLAVFPAADRHLGPKSLFVKSEIEHIPLPDNSVDVIISNCVINLSADKDRVIAEAFHVLKPGGRFAVSDVVVRGDDVPAEVHRSMELWAGCVVGALEGSTYRNKLSGAGFEAIDLEPTRSNAPCHADRIIAQTRQLPSPRSRSIRGRRDPWSPVGDTALAREHTASRARLLRRPTSSLAFVPNAGDADPWLLHVLVGQSVAYSIACDAPAASVA